MVWTPEEERHVRKIEQGVDDLHKKADDLAEVARRGTAARFGGEGKEGMKKPPAPR